MVHFSVPFLRTTTVLAASTLLGRSTVSASRVHFAFIATATSSSPLPRNRAFGTRAIGAIHISPSASLRMSSSSSDGAKRVLVPIGDDSEEIETTCITDTLVRFGASVTVASVKPDGELLCTMSRGIKILADTTIAEAAKEDWDYVVCPGGMPGAEHLRDSEPLTELLKKQKSQNKRYAAICAAPAVVLSSHGLADDAATCYPAPSFIAAMKTHSDGDVVVSGNVMTSKGPGTALKFALQLGEELFGKEKADEIADQMLVKR